ncbi:MAG: GNAT family N-acetyltransferase [Myxococcota bacterium]
MGYRFESTSVDATRPLRAAVLRPGRKLSEVGLPKDEDPRALHVVARDEGGLVVATGSVHPEDRSDGPRPGFRVRGMASDPAHRGRGLGKEVLKRLVDHAWSEGAQEVWCNARTGALSLYERAGFRAVSGVFEIEDIGPHVIMVRS